MQIFCFLEKLHLPFLKYSTIVDELQVINQNFLKNRSLIGKENVLAKYEYVFVIPRYVIENKSWNMNFKGGLQNTFNSTFD